MVLLVLMLLRRRMQRTGFMMSNFVFSIHPWEKEFHLFSIQAPTWWQNHYMLALSWPNSMASLGSVLYLFHFIPARNTREDVIAAQRSYDSFIGMFFVHPKRSPSLMKRFKRT